MKAPELKLTVVKEGMRRICRSTSATARLSCRNAVVVDPNFRAREKVWRPVPWDRGPGGYQVGGFPPGWAEWNDKFRDTVRDYWRGEATPSALAPRLCGSPDIFNRRGRQPWASLHHCARRLYRDGHSHNRSWNHGAEGQMKNMLATLL